MGWYKRERRDDEGDSLEWKREGKERGDMETAGFAFEGALRGRGNGKRFSVKRDEPFTLSSMPDLYA